MCFSALLVLSLAWIMQFCLSAARKDVRRQLVIRSFLCCRNVSGTCRGEEKRQSLETSGIQAFPFDPDNLQGLRYVPDAPETCCANNIASLKASMPYAFVQRYKPAHQLEIYHAANERFQQQPSCKK